MEEKEQQYLQGNKIKTTNMKSFYGGKTEVHVAPIHR